MSPQPDLTTLDVQKYIGPCLISQKPRVRKSNRVKEKSANNNNNNENVLMANNNCNSSVPRLNDYRKIRIGSRNGSNGGASMQSPSPPLAYAICECCGSYKLALSSTCPPPQSPSQTVHQLNIPLTGYPLISMTNSAKKHGMGTKNNGARNSVYQQSNRINGDGEIEGQQYTWEDRSGCQQRGQLSRLAVHTEGAPLILSQRFNGSYNRKYKKYNNNNNNSPFYRNTSGKYVSNISNYTSTSPSSVHISQDFMRSFNDLDLKDDGYALSSDAGPTFDDESTSSSSLLLQREVNLRQSSPFNSDCMSVTSEESSSMSECNFSMRNVMKLKRRRKRVNELSGDVSSSSSFSSSPPPQRVIEGCRNLVTLRPYLPLCYNFGRNDMLNDDDDDDDDEEEDANVEEDDVEGSGEEEEDYIEENFNKKSEEFESPFEIESTNNIEWSGKYPYPASPLCRCATCTSNLSSPPQSPSITSASSSSESSLSDSNSPSPTPPSSPALVPRGSSPTTFTSFSVVKPNPYDSSKMWFTPYYTSNYNVATRIVNTYNNTGSKDLEIKFLYDNNSFYRHYYPQQPQQRHYGENVNRDFSYYDGHDDFSLSQSPEDFTYQLTDQMMGQPLHVTSTQPPSRPWITLTQPTRTHPVCTFTVMCYNVLCDKYATRQMYGYCPNWALNWEYRRKGIMDEIRHYMADVISLQEVETEQFYNMFLPELKKDGYEGIFSPKSRAKTMNENDRKYVDGCAIFFKTNKFRLIKEYLVEFTQLAIAIAEGSDNMLNRVMIRDNIGLVALLETKEGAWENGLPLDPQSIHQPLLVCTAHIHWDPEYCDVKLIQTMMLMNELQNIVEESARSFRPGSKKCDPSMMPLLLCGDFNSLPNSGVIDFLTSGRISVTHPDFKELAYESCLKKLSSSDKPNEYTHCFKIAKAYSNNIMPFTNYTFDFKGIIDYILHSDQSLVPLGLLGPLDAQWMKENKVVGCPHPHIPSDHFPLVVAFEMTPPQISITNGLVLRR